LALRRTADLLNDLESLTDTLSDIQQLVTTLERTSTEKLATGATFNTSILKSHLKSCTDDVMTWVKVTKNADPRSKKSLKAFFRKVKIAADKSGFNKLGRKISGHREFIRISLSIVGRYVILSGAIAQY
jgi:hypothetical protein